MKNIIGIDYGERFIGLAIKKKLLNTHLTQINILMILNHGPLRKLMKIE